MKKASKLITTIMGLVLLFSGCGKTEKPTPIEGSENDFPSVKYMGRTITDGNRDGYVDRITYMNDTSFEFVDTSVYKTKSHIPMDSTLRTESTKLLRQGNRFKKAMEHTRYNYRNMNDIIIDKGDKE